MAKYSVEFKIECINKFKKREKLPIVKGITYASFRRTVLEWSKLYDLHGLKGLAIVTEHKIYSKNLKAKAIKMITNGMNMREVARYYKPVFL